MQTLIESVSSIIGLPVTDYGSQYIWICGALIVVVVYSVFRLIGVWFSK